MDIVPRRGTRRARADDCLQVEMVRAPLLVLSVLLFLLATPMIWRRVLIVTGLTLFWVGGVAPLVLHVSTLPTLLLLASPVEIAEFPDRCGDRAALLAAGEGDHSHGQRRRLGQPFRQSRFCGLMRIYGRNCTQTVI